MKGDVYARHHLGLLEGNAGYHQRAYKHFIIASSGRGQRFFGVC